MPLRMERDASTDGARRQRTPAGGRARTLCRGRFPAWMPALCAVVAILSGCSLFSPVATSYPQIQADGVPLTIEGVEFENLVVVAPSRGAGGVLTGQALNRTRQPIEVVVSIDGGSTPARFTLAPFAGDGISAMPSNVDLGPVPAPPGATVALVISTAAAGENEVTVPVLPPDTNLEYYDGIRP